MRVSSSRSGGGHGRQVSGAGGSAGGGLLILGSSGGGGLGQVEGGEDEEEIAGTGHQPAHEGGGRAAAWQGEVEGNSRASRWAGSCPAMLLCIHAQQSGTSRYATAHLKALPSRASTSMACSLSLQKIMPAQPRVWGRVAKGGGGRVVM